MPKISKTSNQRWYYQVYDPDGQGSCQYTGNIAIKKLYHFNADLPHRTPNSVITAIVGTIDKTRNIHTY